MPETIYEFIQQEEAKYENDEIQVGENWWWNMRRHVQMLFHLKNGVFFTGANDWMRAFKNIMEPILELSAWTEDLDVKDVTFFIEGEDDRALSFLIKKYHEEVYVREHDLDKMFDEITESDLLYGGVLVQKGAKRPEVIQLNRIAFCDQTQMLGGPIGFRLDFSPSKLKQMGKYGWGKKENGATISLEDLCYLASYDKDVPGVLSNKQNKVPGKTIQVYIVPGDMPENWLKDDGDGEKFVSQLQIVALYADEEENKVGVTLYRKELGEDFLKVFSSVEVEGRALGRGVGEKLIHPQIWTNWTAIHKNNLLEAGSKTPLVTDDPSFTNRNKIIDMENNEITTIEEGRTIKRIETIAPANIQLFERAIDEWYQHGQFAGQAFDSLMGKEESAGTTFRGQERLVTQGKGPHDKRRGQRAKFIEELYRWDIVPRMVKEIKGGKKFLATLSTDELAWVSETRAARLAKKKANDMTLNGILVTNEEREMFKKEFIADFLRNGNKQLLEILDGELEGIENRIGINVAGKQKNLSGVSDRILSIIEVAMQNPQFRVNLEANGMMGAFNDLLEYSGLSPADFATVVNTQPVPSPIQQGQLQAPPQAPQPITNGRT